MINGVYNHNMCKKCSLSFPLFYKFIPLDHMGTRGLGEAPSFFYLIFLNRRFYRTELDRGPKYVPKEIGHIFAGGIMVQSRGV